MFHHRSFGTSDLVALMAVHRSAAQQELGGGPADHPRPTQDMAGDFARLATELQSTRQGEQRRRA